MKYQIGKKVLDKYTGSFRSLPDIIVRAPGRINFIGEHTDYNEGFVLPAAIDKSIYVGLGKSNDHQSRIISFDYNDSVTFNNKYPKKTGQHWANYIIGVTTILQKLGKNIGHFNALVIGDIPEGAGLSSSAALENAFSYGLNELFDLGLSQLDLVRISQKAEHDFVGVKCGIMDQFSSMFGEKDHVLKLDCRDLTFEKYQSRFDSLDIILLNSNVAHSLASSEYNIRRAQCEEAVFTIKSQYPEVNSLRDVSLEMLLEFESTLQSTLFKRSKYVIDENMRVHELCASLESGDYHRAGQILYAAHNAMKTEYEITCPEIDFLVETTESDENVIGSRMTGGGFGGCTLNLVRSDYTETWIEKIKAQYDDKWKRELTPITAKITNGVETLDIDHETKN